MSEYTLDTSDITMSVTEIKNAIVQLFNSPEYFKLKQYYSVESFFKTLKISRKELIHSSFIAWLLNPSGNHSLEDFPAKKFLQMSLLCKDNPNNAKATFTDAPFDFLIEDYQLSLDSTSQTEVSVAGTKGGRIDILLELQFKGTDKVLPVIIENKVLTKEHDDQTKNYHVWAEKQYADLTKYYKPIYVFLAPDFDEEIACECEQYIKVSYQNLSELVITPCLLVSTEENTQFIIKNYLRCLSNITLDNDEKKEKETERKIMALSSEEIKLLNDLVEKNRSLFGAIFSARSLDKDLTEEERKIYKSAGTATRDNTKYLFEGKKCYKNQLVLALVKKVCTDKGISTFDELEREFPKEWQGSHGVIKRKSKVTDTTRFYMDHPIKLSGETEDVFVCNQWTIDTIVNILKKAENEGYPVVEV